MTVREASTGRAVGTAEEIAGVDTTDDGLESLPKMPAGKREPKNGLATAAIGKDAIGWVVPQPCNNPITVQRQATKVAECRVNNLDTLCIVMRKTIILYF